MGAGAYTAALLNFYFKMPPMSVVGGMGTITGPISGAYLLTIFNEMLREWEEVRLLIYTAAVVIILLFVTKGVLPTLSEGIIRLFSRRKGG